MIGVLGTRVLHPGRDDSWRMELRDHVGVGIGFWVRKGAWRIEDLGAGWVCWNVLELQAS